MLNAVAIRCTYVSSISGQYPRDECRWSQVDADSEEGYSERRMVRSRGNAAVIAHVQVVRRMDADNEKKKTCLGQGVRSLTGIRTQDTRLTNVAKFEPLHYQGR